jgi:hypothetical protein
MVLSAGDHAVADKSSIVGSIGVIFQKLGLKGLLDHFEVEHKHFATNEYMPLQLVSCFKASSRLFKTWIPKANSISRTCASRLT